MHNISCLLSVWKGQIKWLVLCLWVVFSCGKSGVAPIIVQDETTIIPPTLVSIQSVASDQAELIVKAGFEFTSADWQLIMLDKNGKSLALSAGTINRLDFFNLMPYRIAGLTIGQAYQLVLATRNAGGDSIRVERQYTHRISGPRWLRLTHAPLSGGDFAGSAMSTDNIPGSDPAQLSIWQLKSDDTWQGLSYYLSDNSWYAYKEPYLKARHGMVRFILQEAVGDNQTFSGLGFVTNELLPGQRLYLKDISIPDFAGPDGEVRWFTTLTKAYQLVEGGPSQLWVRVGTWDQYRAADLPEPTGTLATFRLGKTGYVVNQRSNQSAHLWAFDTEREQWTRKADFPGAIRSRGIGFQAGGHGYFGLGITPNQETLRDVWQYDPTTDQWRYVTDYPGAASTYLVVSQVPGHTFMGWGYEQQPTATGGIRLVGCTDFWEFKP